MQSNDNDNTTYWLRLKNDDVSSSQRFQQVSTCPSTTCFIALMVLCGKFTLDYTVVNSCLFSCAVICIIFNALKLYVS